MRGKQVLQTGDLDAGLISAGQVLGLIHDLPTCEVLIERIVQQAKDLIQQRLKSIVR